MAFILKDDLTWVNIKLTSYGRKQLSEGKLKFTKWAIGDSEIDYSFNKKIGFDAFEANILRPKDKNPNIVYFIKSDADADQYNTIPPISSLTHVITNTAPDRGFFDSSTPKKIKTEPTFCKQPDMKIFISGVTGGTRLKIRKAPTYLGNQAEPQVGDYILIKWANPLVTAGSVTPSVNTPLPYIWYKIENKQTGTNLSTDNLILTVDRPLPHFNGQGGSIASGAFLYPNSNTRAISGDSVQTYYGSPLVLDFVNDAVITFLENANAPSIDVGVWNMAIVFTEEIAGIQPSDRNYTQYHSKGYGGFVQYVQKISPTVKNIGIIHYTNNSPSNNYGESLHEDTPVLELPTIMWHFETGGTIGLTLTASTVVKTMTELNTRYRDLVDKRGYIVGKVFNDLKLFVIEDQELLFAMSYKSNRNWTLPQLSGGLNLVLCPPCSLDFANLSGSNPTTIGGSDGTITINVTGATGSVLYTINNGATQTSNVFTGLTKGTYLVDVFDSSCKKSIMVVLSDPDSNLDVQFINVTY